MSHNRESAPPCLHFNFAMHGNIARLTASDTDDKVVAYDAEITVKCSDCGKPFEFIGLPMGVSATEPMCSVDGLEARMPIKPKGEAMPERSGFTRFTLRKVL